VNAAAAADGAAPHTTAQEYVKSVLRRATGETKA
jgi:hypothetical protein